MSKKITDVFDKIVDFDNLMDAYRKVRQGANKYTKDALEFDKNFGKNIKALRESLIDGTYEFGKYKAFHVYDPKTRLIHAPIFVDKVVQIAINNVLKEDYNKTFIYDSYGSIDDKGTYRCVDKIQQNLRSAKYKYGDSAYTLKVDVKKFFYSIDRDILKKIYSKKLKDERAKNLLFKVIDSAGQIDSKGLPLGNTISQLSANVYMNEADQYIKRVLKVKYYVRYMDDMIIVAENKRQANFLKAEISKFLKDKLNLSVNVHKTQIFPIKRGINTIGFKIYLHYRLLRNRAKVKIKRKIKSFMNLVENKNKSIYKCEELLNSFLNHASHGSSYNFIKYLFNRFDNLMFVNGKLKLKLQFIL